MEATSIEQLRQLILDDYPELLSCDESKKMLSAILKLIVTEIKGLYQTRNAPINQEHAEELFRKVLGPSRFHYVQRILETEFEAEHLQMQVGVFAYSRLKKITWECMPVFESLGFADTSGDPLLRHAIIGRIRDLLKGDSILNFPFS